MQCKLTPKDGDILDPYVVKGLAKASTRFLKMYPNLEFKRDIAARVLREQGFVHTYTKFLLKSEDAGLYELVDCFGNDESAEEFLWQYVSEVTGEESPQHQIY